MTRPMGTCSIEGCGPQRIQARGMCAKHYHRVKKYGDPQAIRRTIRPAGCSVEGCDSPNYAREWCLSHYGQWRKHGDPLVRVNQRRTGICELDDCDKPSPGQRYCPMHLERLKRNGNFERQTRTRHIDAAGYVVVKRDGHPLARSTGWLREHRAVLFDTIGPGEHLCHWCATPVSWDRSYPQDADALVVDHVDEVKANNAPENLVPSCAVCNLQRSQPLVKRWGKK